MLLSGLRCDERSRLYPVHKKFSLCKIPGAIDLREPVEIANGSDHHAAFTSVRRYMMRQAVADSGRLGSIQYRRALAVEVSRDFILVEVVEDRCESIAAAELLRWSITFGIHVHNEVSVFGEECHLTLCVPAVRAMGIGVYQLSDRKAICRLFRGHAGMDCHLTIIEKLRLE